MILTTRLGRNLSYSLPGRKRLAPLAMVMALGLLGGVAGQPAAAAEADPAAEVIASGRDLVLTRERLRAELAVLPPEVLHQLADDPQAALTFVNGLAKLATFAAEAERTGVAARPEVQVALRSARSRVLGDALRQQVLEELQEPDFEALAREHYLANRERYQQPEKVTARHILLKVPEDADAAQIEQKRAELAAIAARVRAGEAFAELAREFSEDDGTADLGGKLPAFVRGRMVKPFEEAAFGLREPGELSDVVRTQYGLHLIQLIDYQPGGPMSYEAARSGIVSKLRVDYRHDYLAAWERDLLEAARVDVDADRLRVLMAEARERLAQLPAAGP
jgi:peptidyl-prolyl cis-trans isomerase C